MADTKQDQQRDDISNYRHPEYIKRLPQWNQILDCYNNEVKEKGTEYLPMTGGQSNNKIKENGVKQYNSYKKKALYFNYTKETVLESKNSIVRKETVITLPKQLEYLRNNFNSNKESSLSILDDIYTEQIKMSRIGYLLDPTEKQNDIKFNAVEYEAISIVDWNTQIIDGEKQLVYVLLNESQPVKDESGQWVDENSYRVLGLRKTDDSYIYYTRVLKNEQIEDVKFHVNIESFDESIIESESYLEPNVRGVTLSYIPFFIANADDNKYETQQPLLLNQSDISLGLYRGDADYRRLLYMQTAAMLFIKGISSDEMKTVTVDGIFATNEINADSKYVGVGGEGLSEARLSQEQLHKDVSSFGVVASEKNGQESEESLQARITLKTDKLRDVSKSGARLLYFLYYTAGVWINLTDKELEEIKVEPNLNFKTNSENAQDLKNVTEIWEKGGMLDKDYYNYQKKNNFTTVATFEEWENEREKQNTNVEVIEKQEENK